METSVKLTEWAVGLLTLIVEAAIIYSIVIHRWVDLFLYSLIFAGIMAILMAVVVVQIFVMPCLIKLACYNDNNLVVKNLMIHEVICNENPKYKKEYGEDGHVNGSSYGIIYS